MPKALLICCLLTASLCAQPDTLPAPAAREPSPRFRDGLKLYLTKDSLHYLRGTLVLQNWVRYNANNPGSTLFGYAQPVSYDVGIRRLRFQVFGPVARRVFVYAQFGLNSFNPLSARKAGAFFHDAVTELEVAKGYLSLGAGLTGWSGPARFSSPSVASVMMADAPLFLQATNDVNDQFLRKLGVYAKGKLGRLDYRVIVSKPLPIQTASTGGDTSLSTFATFSPRPAELQYQGYFQWQFLDQESNLLPYTTGTYWGAKRVFNIGAGFVQQANAMRYLRQEPALPGDTAFSDMLLWAVDVFFDTYLNKEKANALSIYAAYVNYDFGPKYLRYAGVMNTANGNNNPALFGKTNFGNAFPMVATGRTIYFQAGYKFRKDLLKTGTLMPYFGLQLGQYQGLKDNMLMAEGGVSWLPGGMHKVSLNYQSRPVFENRPDGSVAGIGSARRGMLYLQYQIAL